MNSNLFPRKGDVKHFGGLKYRYSGNCWILDEVTKNVICVKNSGAGKLYNPHPVNHK
jgi:hypothetical protein